MAEEYHQTLGVKTSKNRKLLSAAAPLLERLQNKEHKERFEQKCSSRVSCWFPSAFRPSQQLRITTIEPHAASEPRDVRSLQDALQGMK
ncbi:hypothetical protein HF521_020101 [Silurus meridionalis]|uniref:Uncharacterized protein n=1 Tax=Silurus meridionalis TaxID=175797 RepID=A0A8T0BMN9_SILME|nr:hypothetical protein HF521_020101 [Silurus meridionalis]